MNELRHLRLLGSTGQVRTEQYLGREHLVVPVVALMEGVIHAVNASVPEFVPAARLMQAAHTWNGRPVVLGHPTLNGEQISANDPRVLAERAFGTVFQSEVHGKRLGMEAWIDPQRLDELGQHEMLEKIRAGEPVEVSVGAHVKTLAKAGVYGGRKYAAEWQDTYGDHLAFLPSSRGACSVEMGCGAGRMAAAHLITAEGIEELRSCVIKHEGEKWVLYTSDGKKVLGRHSSEADAKAQESAIEISKHRSAERLEVLGGPGSGWTAEGGHVPGSQGGKSDDPGASGQRGSQPVRREKAGPPLSVSERHSFAASAHLSASGAHTRAAAILQRQQDSVVGKTNKDTNWRSRPQPEEETSVAARMTKEAGAKSFATSAAAAYSKMAKDAEKAGNRDQAVKYHTEAARYHSAAAKEHEVASTWSKKTRMKGAQMAEGKRTLRERLTALLSSLKSLAPGDTPSEAASEEAAELVGYHTIASLFENMESSLGMAKSTVEDLISDEEENPATTPEDEAAEEEVECARLESVQALCMSMYSTLNAVMNMASNLMMPDPPEAGTPRYMAGKRNSAADQQIIQDMHDQSVQLGADCSALKAAEAATCGCGARAAEGDVDMTKTERIKALLKSGHTPIKDEKVLETLSDEALKGLEDGCAAFEKAQTDLKAAQEKVTETETKLKAAEDARTKPQTDEEFLKTAPPSIKTLVERAQKQEELHKTDLVATLKTAAEGAYTEDELKALSTQELERLLKLAKIEVPDYSGKGVPRAAADGSSDPHLNPPNPYSEKALEAHKKNTTVTH